MLSEDILFFLVFPYDDDIFSEKGLIIQAILINIHPLLSGNLMSQYLKMFVTLSLFLIYNITQYFISN